MQNSKFVVFTFNFVQNLGRIKFSQHESVQYAYGAPEPENVSLQVNLAEERNDQKEGEN